MPRPPIRSHIFVVSYMVPGSAFEVARVPLKVRAVVIAHVSMEYIKDMRH